MNENTVQCVIKTNSNMNNSLIIGESFFPFCISFAFIGFFFLDDPPTLVRMSLSLSLFVSLPSSHSKHRPEGIFLFSHFYIRKCTIFFLYLYSLRLFLRSDLTSFSLQDYPKRRLLESYLSFFDQTYHLHQNRRKISLIL